MSDIQNLSGMTAVEKLKELAKGKACMFCTYTAAFSINSRPMSTAGVDEDGTLWFLSKKQSNKNEEINPENKVELIYMDTGSSAYLTISGNATTLRDQKKIDELWNPIAKAWVPEGKDDPTLELIKVRPVEAYYWDNKHGKLIAFLHILTAAVTGKPDDDGREGNLEI